MRGMRVAEFTYDLATHDYAAFNLHYLMTSEMGLRQQRVFRISVTAVTGIASVLVIALPSRDLVGGMVAGVIAAAFMWLVAPRMWKQEVQRNIKRMAKGDGLGQPGKHTLTVDDSGLREVTPNATVTTPWSSLIRVDETAEHLFIYTDPVRAFVVPKRIGPDMINELLSSLAPRGQ
jgi:hypothetical protein